MQRRSHKSRANWKARVEEHGLHFHTTESKPYWDESTSYLFTTSEVDTLELATNTLNEICLDLVEEIIEQRMFKQFLIPKPFEDLIIRSWEEEHFSIYGRFDLAFDGFNPPKLLEYNADTPTSLLEASVVQWYWLKDTDPEGDQFNSIHEKLLEGWKGHRTKDNRALHFAAIQSVLEDYVTVEYLRDTAIQAGMETTYLDIQQIGWNTSLENFVDLSGQPIQSCFKLYPWEWLLREDFSRHLPTGKTQWMEPAWKILLSCKSILPLLYERHPGCPFLLPASFSPLELPDQVQKPIFSREGANITLIVNGQATLETPGFYGGGPYVYQAMAPMKSFEGNYPVIGSWVINGESAGIGIREDNSIITRNTSRFVPHQMTN